MKTIFIKFALVAILLAGQLVVSACEISMEILDNKKELYHKGDILIVKVKIVFTHRQCPEGINATKLKYEGIKVLGATQWAESQGGIYERKFKLQIEDAGKGKLIFGALRACDKDGGSGSLALAVI